MKHKLLCILLCLCITFSFVPVASAAEDLTDCPIQVLFGATLSTQNVKRDASGVYYAPISWISYFGPNVVHKTLSESPGEISEIDEGWHLFYLQEQEEDRNFARRTFINEKTGDFIVALGADSSMQAKFVSRTKDYGTWWDIQELLVSFSPKKEHLLDEYFSKTGTQVRRVDDRHIAFTQGKFSRIEEIDGEFWVPMAEILSLTDVQASVTGDGKYLCMQPIQDSLLRFLYRRWDELWPLVFDGSDIEGEGIMAAGGWIVATLSGRGGVGIGNKIQSYTDLFTTFLLDNEAYLKAFDCESNADMEYMAQVSKNAGNLNNVFKDFSKSMEPAYQLMVSRESKEIQEQYKSYFTPGKAASSTIGALASLAQYTNVYINQINDHREMLNAVYLYKYNPDPTPDYIAAKNVVSSYSEGAQQICGTFWTVVETTSHGIFNDFLFSKMMGPWYLYLKVGTLFMGDDYQYILDSAQVDENLDISTYSYYIFEDRIFTSQFKGLNPNSIRLSLMLSLISSRHAYKTYWEGSDAKAETIAKIDEILAELYTAGRWQDIDAKDFWYVLKGDLGDEFSELLPANANTCVKDYLANVTDPSMLFDGNVQPEGDIYKGSYGQLTYEFEMGTDDNGNRCITYLSMQPNGEEFPFAYDLTTASTLLEYILNMEDMCNIDSELLPEKEWVDSWFGPYPLYGNNTIIGEEEYEAGGYWAVDSRVYQIVITAGEEGNTPPHRINLFLHTSQ